MSNPLALVLLAVAPTAAAAAAVNVERLYYPSTGLMTSVNTNLSVTCTAPAHCAEASSQMSGVSMLQLRGKGVVSKSHRNHFTTGKHERVQKLKMGLQEVASAIGLSDAGGIQSFSPHAPHAGRSDSIPVPYEVKKSPGKGLGIFVTKPVKKGQMVWRFRPKAHVKILKQDIPDLHKLLKAAHPTVAKWFLRWTYPAAGALFLQMDDGRFTNDASGKKANTKDVGWKQYASRDIEAGEELTEDYRSQHELVVDVPEQYRFLYDEFDPGSEHL